MHDERFCSGPTHTFIGRGFFGLGGPLISVGAPKLISIWFNERERKLAMGIYITGMALGSTTVLSITNSVIMSLMETGGKYYGFTVR